ncbi:MAG: succinate dehydrogenase, cytochrome b556 subunit [Xanthomonadales bacterium]|nr:succinate dehydrogenase, cytochrome b556 subunit [Xanthomonadales bacterium]
MRARPLSPHLQVYRWPLSMAISVLHRASGVFLSLGAVILVWWLYAVARGGAAHEAFLACINSWLGCIALFGWTAAMMLHLLNGVRHLFWDVGMGFSRERTQATGWAVLIGAVVLTSVIWLLAWRAMS